MERTRKEISINESMGEFLLYTSPSGDIKIEVVFAEESIWLTQKRIAALFKVDVRTINEHLTNIFKTAELQKSAVIRKFRITASDGKSYNTNLYSLDAIISVGYRVNSSQATLFRIWATLRIKEYIIKGFTIDDNRLKNGKHFGKDYFKELLERVRSIRASERRIYLQITDIFQECSIDYSVNSPITKEFFATVQNKFHYAITGKTAAEIIYKEANKSKPYMGLKTWKSAPSGRLLKSDIEIAKNYLGVSELKRLERTVSGFFDYIENVIENGNTFTMSDFVKSVNKFLKFNEFRILNGKGNISMRLALKKAFSEYDKFNKSQKIESDFEKHVLRELSEKSD